MFPDIFEEVTFVPGLYEPDTQSGRCEMGKQSAEALSRRFDLRYFISDLPGWENNILENDDHFSVFYEEEGESAEKESSKAKTDIKNFERLYKRIRKYLEEKI